MNIAAKTALVLLIAVSPVAAEQAVLVEAEAFDDLGGWSLDTQFMDQMGSPFLLAHGLGEPVADATTKVALPAAGNYRVWVRTRDWVAPWKAPGAPGRFQVLVDGKALETTFGTEGAAWHWQDGGTVRAAGKQITLALHDLTGFEGRCDAIVLSGDPDFRPPGDVKALAQWRQKALGIPAEPDDGGTHDLVVVGGGIAGTAAAITAARLGLTVALIQDRPVLGGNASSEVRVGLAGKMNYEPYPRIGDVVRELDARARALVDRAASSADKTLSEDELREKIVRDEKTITLLLNHRMNGVEMSDGRISAVLAQHTRTARRVRVKGRYFADCTGDGCAGFLAGADWDMKPTGRMGKSNLWGVVDMGKPASFPRCPWALDLSDKPFPGRGEKAPGGKSPLSRLGSWFWESGFNRDPFADSEYVRDCNLRAMYGAWDALKNVEKRHPNHKIKWAAYVSGPRESRRLLGDVILTQDDVVNNRSWEDACVPCTWMIDLHLPEPAYVKGFEADPFISYAGYTHFRPPYWMPYRCLYSRNVDNLFMAGRDISVTHVALGTTRVMRTCGMMGEIVGMAASLALKNKTTPRGVYAHHLDALKELMKKGAGTLPPLPPSPPYQVRPPEPPQWLATAGENLALKAKVRVSSTHESGKYGPEFINDAQTKFDNARRWVSGPGRPHHVVLTWDKPQTFSMVRLLTGWLREGWIVGFMQDFELAYEDPSGQWRDIPGGRALANSKPDWSVRFQPVTSRRLRLRVTSDDVARLWELEVYHPPAK